jgi:hypothetical protein
MLGGKFSVVEYSDISPDIAKLTDEAGSLVYSAGHVCINYYTVEYFKVPYRSRRTYLRPVYVG